MLNGLSVFITIFQGLLAFIKWLIFIVLGNRKTYKQIFKEIEFASLKRRFRYLKKNKYGYKYIQCAKLLSILKEYFTTEDSKKIIFKCKERGYISFENFDISERIIIRKEDELIEKIINTRKS